MTRQCPICRSAKPLTEFYVCGGTDRRARPSTYCRLCQRERMRALRDERGEQYRATARDYKTRESERVKAVARAHGKTEERRRNARQAKKRARTTNPTVVRLAERRRQGTRRARKRAAFVERVDPVVVFKRDEGVCGICGELVDRTDWHLDHVIPLARGGLHCYENVQVAHAHCNLAKGTRTEMAA